nr:hydroxymethylpyrimidine/phosphomethylpyrimidine kinase [Desulfobulbaceae bacterium]
MMPVKTILSIAGSDPSGGAGLQADLKTFTVLGAYGAAVPTNLTVQNTRGIKASHPVASFIVRDQIDCVLSDLNVSHIKIGMIGTLDIAEAILSSLESFAGEIILDPVLRASDGSNLTDSILPITHLAGKATVLTPNFAELCALSGTCPNSTESLIAACQTILKSFPSLRCIVAKGGHTPNNEGTITDHLVIQNRSGETLHYAQSHPRVESNNTHGTGCTYASAFAAYHQKSGDYHQAFMQSSRFVWQLLKASVAFNTGNGRGGLAHHLFFRGGNDYPESFTSS